MLPLAHQTIAVAETRQDKILAGMLERAGAEVWACPLLAILDAPDQAPVEVWLRALVAGEMDEIIFYTGEGVRRLLASADRLGIKAEVVAALGRVTRVVRGSKPVRELQAIGLREDTAVEPPTTEGVLAYLDTRPMNGRRVGVQLYGTDPNLRLMERLEALGAIVRPVAPYVYAGAAEEAQIEEVIRAMAGETQGKQVDAIVFTAAAQWQRLKEVAETRGLSALLSRGLAQTCVAAVGPNLVGRLEADGVRVDCTPPDETWFMNALVRALGARQGRREDA